MDYLQYIKITENKMEYLYKVLNLVINGLPSIQYLKAPIDDINLIGFKPCYKWITFNTL